MLPPSAPHSPGSRPRSTFNVSPQARDVRHRQSHSQIGGTGSPAAQRLVLPSLDFVRRGGSAGLLRAPGDSYHRNMGLDVELRVEEGGDGTGVAQTPMSLLLHQARRHTPLLPQQLRDPRRHDLLADFDDVNYGHDFDDYCCTDGDNLRATAGLLALDPEDRDPLSSHFAGDHAALGDHVAEVAHGKSPALHNNQIRVPSTASPGTGSIRFYENSKMLALGKRALTVGGNPGTWEGGHAVDTALTTLWTQAGL